MLERDTRIKTRLSCFFGLAFTACTVCFAQVDIYQSDAYSVEEMCAQEAEQSNAEYYSDAYEICIEKNRNNKMYQTEQNEPDDHEHSLEDPQEHSDESVHGDDVELKAEEAEISTQANAN